ncbi:hypothetical protein [Streptomyces sp. NPDC058280]|uniref:hypothetical protein n=1 Tax=Streptomyces sp. NPDC058280 TaxID=3346419 RepID=UPI0036EE0FC6
MRRVVRGFWGPRQESVETLAGRWKLTLDQLAELLPAAGSGAGSGSGSRAGAGAGEAWTWRNVPAPGPAADLRTDEASLLAALRAAQAADDWSDRTGCGLRLVAAGAPGWKIEVSGRAGGTPEILLQSMVIGISSPDGAEIPDAELLTVLADVWEPDFGGVTDDDVLDALEDDAGFVVGEPSVGWVGYLSPARAALLPDGMTAARKELRGGGVLLDIARRGDVDGVVQAYLRLREAGALRPLPRPMDRATL